jgi:hypothetical protein
VLAGGTAAALTATWSAYRKQSVLHAGQAKWSLRGSLHAGHVQRLYLSD